MKKARRAWLAGFLIGFIRMVRLLARDHHLFDFTNRFGRVEAFGAGAGAIHDGVAAIELEGVFQHIETLTGRFIPAIGQPAIGLQQDRRA